MHSYSKVEIGSSKSLCVDESILESDLNSKISKLILTDKLHLTVFN